ncbi:hypothetical protein GCM10009534_25130 [Kribbella sandramycini]
MNYVAVNRPHATMSRLEPPELPIGGAESGADGVRGVVERRLFETRPDPTITGERPGQALSILLRFGVGRWVNRQRTRRGAALRVPDRQHSPTHLKHLRPADAERGPGGFCIVGE